MDENGEALNRQERLQKILSDDLPDWADPDNDGDSGSGQNDSDSWLDEAVDTGGSGQDDSGGWLNDTVDTGGDSNDADGNTGIRRDQQGGRLTVTICRNTCDSCGTTTVRGYHEGCGAPIIHVDSQWRCANCGVGISPDGACFDCGATVDRKHVDVPLDLSLSARSDEIERAVHQETNQRRKSHGLGELRYNHHLSAIALQHSRDMAQRDFFDHHSPDGAGAADRYRKFGHDDRSSGENIALIHPGLIATPQEAARSVVDDWMNSKGHRENILREQFTEEGIGIYLTPEGEMYATQNFY